MFCGVSGPIMGARSLQNNRRQPRQQHYEMEMPENSYYHLAYLLLALYSGHAAAAECESANTQRDMNICFDRVRQLADEGLTRTYQNAMKMASDKATKSALRDSERAWISYRDKECEFKSSGVRGGSVRPMIFSICLTEKFVLAPKS